MRGTENEVTMESYPFQGPWLSVTSLEASTVEHGNEQSLNQGFHF